LIADLDTLPFVDYSFLPAKPQAVSRHGFYIDVGRGCPFGCTYCSTKSFWGRKFRLKSPQRIVEEIKRVYEEFGVTYFNFAHDMFTLNRASVVEVCRLIKQLDFPITWRCSARIDCIDNELIDLMADAGLKYIFIGIETCSVRMQKIVNKNLKLDKVLDILSHIREKGIKTITSFIYGFPEETEEDISQTLAMIGDILKIGGVTVQTHLCTFLSGTEMSIKYHDKLVPANIFSDLTGGTAIDECSELIVNNPDVFCHFYEYHSELRSRLEFFSLFCRVWASLQPVFQYIAQKYPRDYLIRMYDDFVADNRETLQGNRDKAMSEQIMQVIEKDRFVERFKGDAFYDLIRDYYRMIVLQYSKKLQRGSVTEVFSFSPARLKGRTSIEQFERRLSVVTFTRNEDDLVSMHVRS
jgi:uncharacterized Fe-S cluster-containing radical SAM superfamily protein